MPSQPSAASPPPSRGSFHGIQVDAIYQQLDKVLASEAFADSTKSGRFLELLVDSALQGKPRAGSHSDTARRLLIRRLSARLSEYYSTEGAQDPIVITLPEATGVPMLRRRGSDEEVPLLPPAPVPRMSAGDPGPGFRAEAVATKRRQFTAPEAPVEPSRQRDLRPVMAEPELADPAVSRKAEAEAERIELRREPDPEPFEEAREPRRKKQDRAGISPWTVGGGVILLATGFAAGAFFPFLRDSDGKGAGFGAFQRLTADSGVALGPTVSLERGLIAYASDRQSNGSLNLWIQEIAGGAVRRLTNDDADDYEPSLSPDGSQVVFRSDREGGGVYLVSSSGGDAKRLVKSGRGPRFSPKGDRIAYWIAGEGKAGAKIYVIPRQGGAARQVAADFASALSPVWSPDGRRLLFGGQRSASPAEQPDWWVAEVDGTGVDSTEAITARRMPGLGYGRPSWWADGDRILFDATLGQSRNTWQVTLNRKWKAGKPDRLAAGTDNQSQALLTPDGQLFFAEAQSDVGLWGLPVDANQGKATGDLSPVISGGAPAFEPSLTRDGSKAAFLSDRLGSQGAFLIDIASLNETRFSAALKSISAVVSPDGATTAYLLAGQRNRRPQVYLVSQRGGVEKTQLCDTCEHIYSFSPDGSRILFGARHNQRNPMWIGIFDLATGSQTRVLGYPEFDPASADLSPDARWVAVASRTGEGRSEVSVVSIDGGVSHKVSEDPASDDKPRWSPDGKTVYFLSSRDGNRCLWARHVEGGQPSGHAWAVRHLHSRRYSASGMGAAEGLAVARERIVLTLKDNRSNIWVASPR